MAALSRNGRDVRSNMEELLEEARRDLLSQTGRVLPNLNIALGAGEVALQGGLLDDRKYLVCVFDPRLVPKVSCHKYNRSVFFFWGRSKTSSSSRRHYQMTPSFVAASMRSSSRPCGRPYNILPFPTWATSSDTVLLMAPTTYVHCGKRTNIWTGLS